MNVQIVHKLICKGKTLFASLRVSREMQFQKHEDKIWIKNTECDLHIQHRYAETGDYSFGKF